MLPSLVAQMSEADSTALDAAAAPENLALVRAGLGSRCSGVPAFRLPGSLVSRDPAALAALVAKCHSVADALDTLGVAAAVAAIVA